MFGAIDLAAELATERRTDGLEMIYARSRLVAESAAAGILPPIDSAHALVDDLPGIRAECQLSRSLGFRGKVCIHPVQVEVANQTFERDSEVAWAHSVIRAYEDAGREGVGVIRLEGEMVDRARQFGEPGDCSRSMGRAHRARRSEVAAGRSPRTHACRDNPEHDEQTVVVCSMNRIEVESC